MERAEVCALRIGASTGTWGVHRNCILFEARKFPGSETDKALHLIPEISN